MKLLTGLLVVFIFLPLLTAQVTDTLPRHPFSVHDLVNMRRISEPKISPDGKQIVYVLRTTDLEANKGKTDLWLMNLDDESVKQLTSDPGSDTNPCWSPDGCAIYFLSDRSGSSQVWRISCEGGEAQQVTDLQADAGNLVVSPDGSKLAFTIEVFPGLDIAETQKQLQETADKKSSGLIFNQVFVRHWDRWKDGRRSHLFVLSVGNEDPPVDIMKDMDADTPSQPFGGSEEFTFTPDSRGVVFSARDAGREEAWSTNFDLYYAPADGSEPPENLTSGNKAWDTQPVFSPDGKTLAYMAMKRPGYESDRFRIVLMDWPGRKIKTLTEKWDRSPSIFIWSENGKKLYATASHFGQRSLFSIDVKTGKTENIVYHGTIRSVMEARKRLIFSMDHLESPVELYSVKTNGKDIKQITSVNADKLKDIQFGKPEQFTFKGWNDETIYGYIVKPVDFDPLKKYPVAFLIHGGPQGSFGNDFHYRWNPQTYAGAGYAAVMVDFHGSVGYGQAFTDAIRNDWGGKPLEDLQKGLAAALDRYPWMDGDRIGALGASYGGYMINWIAGQWPDRFRCLVTHDGNLDERFAYYDTEELWFPEWDHAGTPWENPDRYEKQNPVNYVQNWKTPMLVIHGEKDFRVVNTQGLATFNVLQRRGIPSKLLYFPDENHWVLKPYNSIQWHDTVIGWLDQWLK